MTHKRYIKTEHYFLTTIMHICDFTVCDNDQLESEFFINPQGSYVPLVVMTSVRQQRSVCDLASFCGSRHSSSILATQRRKASSDSGLTKQGWRGNGRATSSGLGTHGHTHTKKL